VPCLTWPAPQRALKPKCHAQDIRSFSYKSQAASCPQSMIWKESYWANRAEQARATVESIRNPECRRIVREIAVSFDPWQSLRATSRAVRGHRRRCRDPKRLRGIEPHPLVRKRTVPLIGEWSLDLCSSVAACRSEPGMKAQQAIEGAPLGADTFKIVCQAFDEAWTQFATFFAGWSRSARSPAKLGPS
jgi:hypothetical protein